MPEHRQRLGVALREDADRHVRVELVLGVDDLSVHLGGERGLGEAGTDFGGDVSDRGSRWELENGTVGESDLHDIGGRRTGCFDRT